MVISSMSINPRSSIFLNDTNGNEVLVLNINANLNPDSKTYDINYTVINSELLIANKDVIQTHIDNFKASVIVEAQAKGFVVFI